MRWVLAAVAVLGLAACGPRDEGGSGTTTRRSRGVAGADSSSPARRSVPRARAAAPPVTCPAPSEQEWPPPDSREPSDPPPPPSPDAWVRGRIVDPTGAPIPRARVACFLGVSTDEGWSDREGRFRVEVYEPTGVVRIITWADGWAVDVGLWREMPLVGEFDAGTIALSPAARISGRIVDEFGETLPGNAGLRIDASEVFDAETWALLERRTDFARDRGTSCHSSMEFKLTSLPPGRYRLTFGLQPWTEREADPVTVGAPVEDVIVRSRATEPPAPPDFDVCLAVVPAEGESDLDFPLALAVAPEDASAVVRWTWRGPYDAPIHTRLHARVTAPNFPVRLVVSAADGATGWADVTSRPSEDVRIELHHPVRRDRNLEGVVTSGGEPIGSAARSVTISASRADGNGGTHQTAQGPDGSWLLAGLEDAEYVVVAWADEREEVPELAATDLTCRPGAKVTLELPRAARRSFRILPPEGSMFDDFDCRTEPLSGTADSSEWVGDWAAGRISATGLRPGDAYRLVARARVGRTWTAWTRVEGWTAGDEVLDLHLDAGLRIEGSVIREDGSPVPCAYLYAEAERDDDEFTDVYAGLDGRFVLTGASPGCWNVLGCTPALSNESAPVETHSGSTGVLVVLRPRSEE